MLKRSLSAAGSYAYGGFRVMSRLGSVFVVVFVVVVEGDAVLFRQRGVFVVLSLRALIIANEPQVNSTGTSLLQLSRFFKAAMTTLLHGRAPNLEK